MTANNAIPESLSVSLDRRRFVCNNNTAFDKQYNKLTEICITVSMACFKFETRGKRHTDAQKAQTAPTFSPASSLEAGRQGIASESSTVCGNVCGERRANVPLPHCKRAGSGDHKAAFSRGEVSA
jgi:hypothetical protein